MDAIFFAKLETFLENNINNPDLKAEFVATLMGMSKSTLNRKMKKHTGKALIEFICHFRIQKAKAILMAGYTVQETSQHVGFKTPSYFSFCFKKHLTMTPKEFVAFNQHGFSNLE